MFFLLSTLPMMIEISGKSAHLAQKCYFCQKTTNKQSSYNVAKKRKICSAITA